MNTGEEAVFADAIEIADPTERAAFLDRACAGNADLRASVESLLGAYPAGSFLEVPALKASENDGPISSGPTEAEPGQQNDEPVSLEFLAPSEKPGSLGRLGHYEVQEIIGQGGMGVVLRAFDEKLHRVVAIKVMAAQLATNATARKRFTREAQAQAAVSHDHIVTIHAVDEANGLPYLVMQYVAGMSLQERLEKSGPLQLHEILRIGMQTASGLAAAHAQGLVHRDIKPANILLENGVERVKITDFGLARAATEASLTQSGVVAGTPQYMSPEQAEGKAIDQRTDLFSLGSVLYAMCTGRAPFRASGSMAVLKRVCEQTPMPIREANAEIPEWLVAIIDKLHAKDPAERYRSASEVAELLGQHLAQVQHPSFVSNLSAEPKANSKPTRRGHLAIAVALLMCLVAGISFTEATGVTNVRGTVIRIFTPDGTLVVETNDSGVKVTIEGDGGLVITGAGLEEIRLRPGSYKVHANRDGKPVILDRELVSITKNGREIVKVKLQAPSAQAVAKTEKGAFVLLTAGKERKFDTLAEAVQAASAGDTIEIRGNGPFVSDCVTIQHPLVIRAGTGYTPVITQASPERNVTLLSISAPLVLEGLEMRWMGGLTKTLKGRALFLLEALGCGSLHIANCRLIFKAESPEGWPFHTDAKSLSVRNSVLSGNVDGTSWRCASGSRCNIENSVSAAGGIGFAFVEPDVTDVTIHVRGNTLVGNCLTLVTFGELNLREAGDATPPIRMDCSGNVARSAATSRNQGFLFFQNSQKKDPFSVSQAEAFLPRFIRLDEKQNVYQAGYPVLQLAYKLRPIEGKRGRDLADWDRFWSQKNTGSVEGDVRFQGGDLIARARSAPEKLTPEDFRLRPDSAGYKAGKDGKDLGADVDLVGPGPAYERWKKTPAYQQWLKDTGQLRAETTKPDAGAFVLLVAGKERKFATLAEAVQTAGDGDTIEVRGNGPFVTEPVNIGSRVLVIRAGTGFRPVIELSAAGILAGEPLLASRATLVLEGLELRRSPPPSKGRRRTARDAILYVPNVLHVANCRLRTRHDLVSSPAYVTTTFLNCEILNGFGADIRPGSRLSFENCMMNGGIAIPFPSRLEKRELATIRLIRNTHILDRGAVIAIYLKFEELPKLPLAKGQDIPVQAAVEVTGTLFDVDYLLHFHHRSDAKVVRADDTETIMKDAIAWRWERNCYATCGPIFRHNASQRFEEKTVVADLAGWKQFWGSAETGSVEGKVRFQGGDLLGRLWQAPEKVTPDDYRLRPDSAGYRAGKDGKDLGADMDLVGPGAAYERWKKTPAYQQWLKDTKQVK